MSFTRPHWSCEQEPDGECTVVIALGDDVARVSTKGRPSFQTVEDSVYTIVECYRDYFYAEPVDFDLERMQVAVESPRRRLPDGPLTKEEIGYYLSHPEECELVIRGGEEE